jgi:hypothetical protein
LKEAEDGVIKHLCRMKRMGIAAVISYSEGYTGFDRTKGIQAQSGSSHVILQRDRNCFTVSMRIDWSRLFEARGAIL